MTSRIFYCALVLAVSALAAGCRQADGPMPVAADDVPNRLGDLSRDLASVARGEAQARQDLADDLRVFIDDAPDAMPALDELVKRTSDVVVGHELNEQNAQRLAHQLWTAVAGREMSERQVEALQTQMQALLVSVGVPEQRAADTAAQVEEVQKVVTNRNRRWYEFF